MYLGDCKKSLWKMQDGVLLFSSTLVWCQMRIEAKWNKVFPSFFIWDSFLCICVFYGRNVCFVCERERGKICQDLLTNILLKYVFWKGNLPVVGSKGLCRLVPLNSRRFTCKIKKRGNSSEGDFSKFRRVSRSANNWTVQAPLSIFEDECALPPSPHFLPPKFMHISAMAAEEFI